MADSGAAPKPLFPRAWKYYDGIVATFGLLLIVLNTLIGTHILPVWLHLWFADGVAAVTAVLIWLRFRAYQLGVVSTSAEHLQPPETEDKKG